MSEPAASVDEESTGRWDRAGCSQCALHSTGAPQLHMPLQMGDCPMRQKVDQNCNCRAPLVAPAQPVGRHLGQFICHECTRFVMCRLALALPRTPRLCWMLGRLLCWFMSCTVPSARYRSKVLGHLGTLQATHLMRGVRSDHPESCVGAI